MEEELIELLLEDGELVESSESIRNFFPFEIKKAEVTQHGDFYIAGYASVELVDKQGDLIPLEALKAAFEKFMTNEKYRAK